MKGVFVSFEIARIYGLLYCKCGHTRTQHYTHSGTACAHCDCKRCREVAIADAVILDVFGYSILKHPNQKT